MIITFEIDFKCDDGVYDNIDEILSVYHVIREMNRMTSCHEMLHSHNYL